MTQGWDGGSTGCGGGEGAGGNEGAVVGRVHVWGHEAEEFRLQSVGEDTSMSSPFPFRANSYGANPHPLQEALLLWSQQWSRKQLLHKKSPNQVPRMCRHLSLLQDSLAQREKGPRSHVHAYPSGRFSPNMHPCSSLRQNAPPPPHHSCLVPEVPLLVPIFHLSKHCSPYIIHCVFKI